MKLRIEHWRRSLKNGGCEFFFAAGRQRMKGSVSPLSAVDGLQAVFEKTHSVTLPEPEWKPQR